ncbi:hypothetical protein HEB94_008970 [Actinopolymorpha pittospori]|uniref:ATP-dependent DNA ligase family profile domain-containing protein n=1 Tax=Actinopolymorpha pittospori TaxID=648752 RepID=A0A927RD92_9ACTN|nr:hypothetical protein [Actinopolymorpha pittospori]
MLAKSIDRLPAPRAGGWRYEPKFDGYRALASIRADSSVQVHSRRGTPLDDAFPELVGALYAYLPAGTVIEGEIVCWAGGRLDSTVCSAATPSAVTPASSRAASLSTWSSSTCSRRRKTVISAAVRYENGVPYRSGCSVASPPVRR